jgi:hypothetical protein
LISISIVTYLSLFYSVIYFTTPYPNYKANTKLSEFLNNTCHFGTIPMETIFYKYYYSTTNWCTCQTAVSDRHLKVAKGHWLEQVQLYLEIYKLLKVWWLLLAPLWYRTPFPAGINRYLYVYLPMNLLKMLIPSNLIFFILKGNDSFIVWQR